MTATESARSVVLADTHVHVYPAHDPGATLAAGFHHLEALAPAGTAPACALLLTERFDCHYFQEWKQGRRPWPAGWEAAGSDDPDALTLRGPNGQRLFVAAGRQVISAERIEVLALTRDLDLPDGRPVAEVLDRVRDAGAVPVLSWAPGKWFFRRGRIIRSLIESGRPDQFLIGDTTLRPMGWPEPLLMRAARARGFRLVAGSDPLPFAGEERVAGRYGVRLEGPFEPDQPAASLRALLQRPDTRIALAGSRGGVLSVLLRLKRNRDCRKPTPPADG
jgi:hypothetical protein